MSHLSNNIIKWNITMDNKKAKSWSINATSYIYSRIFRRKTKAHHDANNKTEKEV